MPDSTKVSENDLPAMYRSWNEASLAAQQSYLQVHRAVLTLLFGGAITSAAVGMVCTPLGKVLAIVTAVTLFGSMLATASIRTRKQSSAWYDGRALAESAKSIAWKYMLRAAPYVGHGPGSDRLFVQDLRRLLGDAQQTGISGASHADGDQISDRMREVRSLGFDERISLYKTARLQDQRRWYAAKALQHEKLSKRWVGVAIGAQVLACGLSLIGISWVAAVGWVGVFTTVTSSALTWTQLRRHEELAHSYAFTSHELGFTETRLPSLTTESELAQFVSDCENAVSREHTMWRARRELAEPLAGV